MKKLIIKLCKIFLEKYDKEVLIPENMNYKMAVTSILSQSEKGRSIFFSILMDRMSIEQLDLMSNQAKEKKHYKRRKQLANLTKTKQARPLKKRNEK